MKVILNRHSPSKLQLNTYPKKQINQKTHTTITTEKQNRKNNIKKETLKKNY